MITDKNALSIGESIGWKKLVGQVELPKLSCELSGSKGREHSEDFRVEALVTQCSPHSPGREDFPHPVPRFQPFSPD